MGFQRRGRLNAKDIAGGDNMNDKACFVRPEVNKNDLPASQVGALDVGRSCTPPEVAAAFKLGA